MGKIHEALEKAGHEKKQIFKKDRPQEKQSSSIAKENTPLPQQPRMASSGGNTPETITPQKPPLSQPIAKKDIQTTDRSEKSVPAVFSPPLQPEHPPVFQNECTLDPCLITYHDPTGVESEIFKILRTNILFPKNGAPPRSIMVTSAIPGDGKSFVSTNLAISIAQGVEEHVLLMDCDMRRSTVHTRLGFSDDVPGLSDFLKNEKTLESVLKKTVVEKLTLLPGGTYVSNPSELLSSQAMRTLFEEVKTRYSDRYVIVDSPPPQLTAETTALANYVDAILVVVRYAATPTNLVRDLLERLGREKIIGVVLNGYRVPTTERYGYGKYKKYKKY